MFYAWASDTGRIPGNPARGLPRVRVPRSEPSPTSEDSFSRAVSASTDRDGLMLLLGGLAGLRAAEIAAVRWRDVEEDVLRVCGKGGRVRRVPIHPRLLQAFEREEEVRRRGELGTGNRYGDAQSPYLFPGQSGGHLAPGSVSRILSRNLGSKGHGLRHRFATIVHERGASVLVLQQLLGHASPNTTAIYVRISLTHLHDAVRLAS